jgi:hypothetical protein
MVQAAPQGRVMTMSHGARGEELKSHELQSAATSSETRAVGLQLGACSHQRL